MRKQTKKNHGAKPATKQGATQTKAETVAPATRTATKVEPWRDWARRLCDKAGLLWKKRFEEAKASGAPVELRCSMFYESAELAFRDFAPEVAAAGLTELLGEVEREREAMRRDPTMHGAWARLAVAVDRFPQTLCRIAESPEAHATPGADLLAEVRAQGEATRAAVAEVGVPVAALVNECQNADAADTAAIEDLKQEAFDEWASGVNLKCRAKGRWGSFVRFCNSEPLYRRVPKIMGETDFERRCQNRMRKERR